VSVHDPVSYMVSIVCLDDHGVPSVFGPFASVEQSVDYLRADWPNVRARDRSIPSSLYTSGVLVDWVVYKNESSPIHAIIWQADDPELAHLAKLARKPIPPLGLP